MQNASEGVLRGHAIVFENDRWVYKDSNMPTAGNPRKCGHCGKAKTDDGHDGCLGELPGLMNACCGHGNKDEAYMQFLNGSILRGLCAYTFLETKRA